MADQTQVETMTTAEPASFSSLEPNKMGTPLGSLEFIQDVPLRVSAQLGASKILVKDLLQLGQGSIIELEKAAGEPLDVFVGDKLVARGEVVVINEKFGVRITDIVNPADRLQQPGR